jgi:YVTN family beta-propeller protein
VGSCGCGYRVGGRAGGCGPERDVGIGRTPGCRATAFVTNALSATASTIDVKSRAKHPGDIEVGALPTLVAFTPDGKTAFIVNRDSNTVSTIDVKTRTKNPADIPVGSNPLAVAVTPCHR